MHCGRCMRFVAVRTREDMDDHVQADREEAQASKPSDSRVGWESRHTPEPASAIAA